MFLRPANAPIGAMNGETDSAITTEAVEAQVELAHDAMEVEREDEVPAGRPQLLQPTAPQHPNSAGTEAANGRNGTHRQAALSEGQQQGLAGSSQQAPHAGEQPAQAQEAEEQAAARVKAILQKYDDKYKRYTKEVRQEHSTAQSVAGSGGKRQQPAVAPAHSAMVSRPEGRPPIS